MEYLTERSVESYSGNQVVAMAKVLRAAKNVTKGYSSVQVKVRNGNVLSRIFEMSTDSILATSNDPWGPTGTEMSEIAQMTFSSYADALAHKSLSAKVG